MDYTAIVVALISLFGMIWQTLHNGRIIKRNNIKTELQRTETKLDVISKGQMYLLQEKLLTLCKKHLDRGEIAINDLKLLTNIYHVYHDLDGNDFITDLYERVKELPVK